MPSSVGNRSLVSYWLAWLGDWECFGDAGLPGWLKCRGSAPDLLVVVLTSWHSGVMPSTGSIMIGLEWWSWPESLAIVMRWAAVAADGTGCCGG